MEEHFTDLLVIGSGLAGTLSALEAEKAGLQVLLTSKFAIGMGTNSSLAGAGFTAANPRFSKEQHLRATLESGRGLNHLQLVKILVNIGPEAMERLRNYGVPIVETIIGFTVDRPEGASQLPGVLLIKPLVNRLKGSSIRLVPGLVIFDLVIEEGRIRGGFGFFKNGKPCLIQSKAVILATGGAGAIFRRNDNQRSILGDGYALALRAGLPLLDMEFIQYYPFVLAEPGLSTFLLYPPYPKEARLINEKGEDLSERLGIQGDFNRAIISERDRVSIALHSASESGDVYFDLTRVPGEIWSHYPLNFLTKSKFPYRERPFLVSPAVHFFMGGIEIDEKGGTALPGLFAAGEVVWGIHGANRFGGNALTECAVFGPIAGQSAAEYVRLKDQSLSGLLSETSRKKWIKKADIYLKKRRGTFDHPDDLFKDLKNLAWKYAGPIREEESLKEGLSRIDSIEKRIERVYPASQQDLFKKKALENGAFVIKAILKGSLLRKESRGSFFRKDFPNQDDANRMKNTCCLLEEGGLKITTQKVPASL